jgi:hypothetical protein
LAAYTNFHPVRRPRLRRSRSGEARFLFANAPGFWLLFSCHRKQFPLLNPAFHPDVAGMAWNLKIARFDGKG